MRLRNFLAITAAVLLATLSVVVSPRAVGADPKSDEQVFVAKINGLRALNGLPALAVDSELTTQARAWTHVMADTNSLRHASDFSIGISTPWDLLGENVGRHRVHDLDALFVAFVNSPSHLANLLNNRFDRVGVGVVYGPDGTVWTTHRFMSVDGASAPSESITETPPPTSVTTSATTEPRPPAPPTSAPPIAATSTTTPPATAPPTTAPPTTRPPTTGPPTTGPTTTGPTTTGPTTTADRATTPPTTAAVTTAPTISAPRRTATTIADAPTSQPTTTALPSTRPVPAINTTSAPPSSPSSTATSVPTVATRLTPSATLLEVGDTGAVRPALRAQPVEPIQPIQPAASAEVAVRWLVETGGGQAVRTLPASAQAPAGPWPASSVPASTGAPSAPEIQVRNAAAAEDQASIEADIDRFVWVMNELASAGL